MISVCFYNRQTLTVSNAWPMLSATKLSKKVFLRKNIS